MSKTGVTPKTKGRINTLLPSRQFPCLGEGERGKRDHKSSTPVAQISGKLLLLLKTILVPDLRHLIFFVQVLDGLDESSYLGQVRELSGKP